MTHRSTGRTMSRTFRTLAVCFGLFWGPVVCVHGQTAEWKSLMARIAVLCEKGDYESALVMAERALGIAEKSEARDQAFVAQSLSVLGNIYRSQERRELAVSMYERSLGIQEKALGREHLDLAQNLDGLADIYY